MLGIFLGERGKDVYQSHHWISGDPHGVELRVEFEQGSGSNPMMEMMMKASPLG